MSAKVPTIMPRTKTSWRLKRQGVGGVVAWTYKREKFGRFETEKREALRNSIRDGIVTEKGCEYKDRD